jgi:hypothetical protein
MINQSTRPIWAIAEDIQSNWPNVYFGAVPYLQAMTFIEDIGDFYYQDSAADIVRYFLSNAKTWRGDAARRIKAELKALVA